MDIKDQLPNNDQLKQSSQPNLHEQRNLRRQMSFPASQRSRPQKKKSWLWLGIVLSVCITASVILLPSISDAFAKANAVTVKLAHATSAVTATNTAYPDLLPGFAKKQLAGGLNHPVVFAFAQRSGNSWTVLILDGTLPTVEKRSAQSDLGGTMRLGAQPCEVVPGSLAGISIGQN